MSGNQEEQELPCDKQTNSKNFLVFFFTVLPDFRLAELNSLASLHGINFEPETQELDEDEVFVKSNFAPNDPEILQKMMSRSVLAKSIFELLVECPTHEEFFEEIKNFKQRFSDSQNPTIAMKCFGLRRKTTEKDNFMLKFLDQIFDSPDQTENEQKKSKFKIIHQEKDDRDEDDEENEEEPAKNMSNDNYFIIEEHLRSGRPNFNPNCTLKRIFLAKKLAKNTNRHQMFSKYDLKNRKFLGTTAMSVDLSFLVANQAQIVKNHLVMDPFCGSASLLIAAGQLGAKVFGSDLDFRVLCGGSKFNAKNLSKQITDNPEYNENVFREEMNHNIFSNFKQYDIEKKCSPNFLRADFSQQSNLTFWRDNFLLDCIISDPPYGKRERTKKIGSKKEEPRKIPEEYLNKKISFASKERMTPEQDCIAEVRQTHNAHYVSSVWYGFKEMYLDLFHFAKKHLRVGGRLVFWVPCSREKQTQLELKEKSQKMIKKMAKKQEKKAKFEKELDEKKMQQRQERREKDDEVRAEKEIEENFLMHLFNSMKNYLENEMHEIDLSDCENEDEMMKVTEFVKGFKLISMSTEWLSLKDGRRLVTVERIC